MEWNEKEAIRLLEQTGRFVQGLMEDGACFPTNETLKSEIVLTHNARDFSGYVRALERWSEAALEAWHEAKGETRRVRRSADGHRASPRATAPGRIKRRMAGIRAGAFASLGREAGEAGA